MIRVIIAEDHDMVREGIRALIEKSGDIEVVGEADNGRQAVEMVKALSPDVLVTDISMPEVNGIEALQKVRALELSTEVVMLSMYSSEVMIRQALHAGARGYLLKDSVSDELRLAIRAAARGATYLSTGVRLPFEGQPQLDAETGIWNEPVQMITDRESEVLQLIGRGQTNKQIAEVLSISVKTVERHRASLMAKLGVDNLVGLVRTAIRHGLLSIEESF